MIEDGQIIQIKVRKKGEDNFGTESENSEDEEVNLKPSESKNNNATRNLERGEISQSDEETRAICKSTNLFSTNRASGNEGAQVHMLQATDFKAQVIDETVSRVQDMIDRSGILETASLIKRHFGGKDSNVINTPIVKDNETIQRDDNHSEITVYHNAVKKETEKRESTSSEEEITPINTSNENEGEIEDLTHTREVDKDMLDQFISEQRKEVEKCDQGNPQDRRQKYTLMMDKYLRPLQDLELLQTPNLHQKIKQTRLYEKPKQTK